MKKHFFQWRKSLYFCYTYLLIILMAIESGLSMFHYRKVLKILLIKSHCFQYISVEKIFIFPVMESGLSVFHFRKVLKV